MSDNSHFFAHLARMKLINRWPLMHNVRNENVQEHSLQVAMVAHALALIKNKFLLPLTIVFVTNRIKILLQNKAMIEKSKSSETKSKLQIIRKISHSN